MVIQVDAPERLSLSEATAFSGPDLALREFLIREAVVNARAAGGQSFTTIKEPLREYLETAPETARGLWG